MGNKKSNLSAPAVSAPSVERNRESIKNVLSLYLGDKGRVLEIGSGTGEHAIYFGENFKNHHWVTSDRGENHAVIKEWLKFKKLPNVHGPELLEIGVDDFPKGEFQFIFTANTLHIMSWKEVKSFLKLLGKRMRKGAIVFFYGPFNYNGEFTSESNANFDIWLKDRNEKSGIRNFEDIERLMLKSGFQFLKDHEMPANNRILAFERLEFKR